MSFDLPRSRRSLRFTGSVKALAAPDTKSPQGALGRERPKARPAGRPAARGGAGAVTTPAPQTRTARGDVYAVEVEPTPYVASRPSERAHRAERVTPEAPRSHASPARTTLPRAAMPSLADEAPTQTLDRDALGIPGLQPRSAPPPTTVDKTRVLPVPHFRSAEEALRAREPTVIVARADAGGGPFPLTFWLAVALLFGVVTYHYAPHAMTSLERAVGLLEAKAL